MQGKLAAWFVKSKCSAVDGNSLLKVLQGYDSTLPTDVRTLVCTPRRSNIEYFNDDTSYVYFGIRNIFTKYLAINYEDIRDNDIIFDLNGDGVPISNSSSSQLFPILLNVLNDKQIYIVCCIHRKTNRSIDWNRYLGEFANELCFVLHDGITFKGRHYNTRLRSFSCDSPARADMLNIYHHNGRSPCHKCIIVSKRFLGRQVFTGVKSTARSFSDYYLKIDKGHYHSGSSPFDQTDINVRDIFTMDYMHCVLLGVMKQLLTQWIDVRKRVFSIQADAVRELSSIHLQISKTHPPEFARRPRAIDQFKRFKATEFRQLLLYTLPVMLKDKIATKFYKHFLLLHCAIRILCNPDTFSTHSGCANEMLVEFVRSFKNLYGLEYCTYNLHCLLHLAEDCKNMRAPLDDYSCFKFENFLQILKKIPKNGHRVLEQISNRMIEKEKFNANKINRHTNMKFSYKDDEIHKVDINGLTLGVAQPNNLCLVFIQDKFEVGRIIRLYKNGDMDIRAIKHLESIPGYPIDSFYVRMYRIGGINDENFRTEIIKYSLSKKLMKIFYLHVNGKHYLATMLHSNYVTNQQ